MLPIAPPVALAAPPLLDAAVLLSNNGTLENLDTLTRAFLDAVVNLDGVTDVEVASDFLQLAIGQMLDQIHVYSFLSIIDVRACLCSAEEHP